MALIRVDGVGVGRYEATNGKIEAEDYFKASGTSKVELGTGFAITDIDHEDFLTFPNINDLENKSKIQFKIKVLKNVTIEIHKDSPEGELVASYNLKGNGKGIKSHEFDFPKQESRMSLCFVFKGKKKNLLVFDSFKFN